MDIKSFKKTKLPDKPGVYFFQKGGKTLYIGKATSLRDRVKSYFGKDLIQTRGPLLVDMVFKADKIMWEAADTVLEALILEANLIKKHKPYFNSREKDDKSFNYVCITREKLPRVVVIRGKDLLQKQVNFSRFTLPGVPGGSYTTKNSPVSFANTYGPYTSGLHLREAMKIIRRIFPFIDESSSKKQNYEFYRQIGLTPDTKGELVASPTYLQNIKYLKMFLSGKKKQITKDIKKEMMQEAKERNFERAQELKHQLFALQHINDVSLLKNPLENRTSNMMQDFRIEAYDIAHMSGKSMVGVMTVVTNGEATKSEYKKFNIRTQSASNDTGALTEVLSRRFNHPEWAFPQLVVVDGGVAQLNTGKSVIQKIGINIDIVSVVKDDRHRPKAIMGSESMVAKHKRSILLANSEAHRFAIAFHKKKRAKNFLK